MHLLSLAPRFLLVLIIKIVRFMVLTNLWRITHAVILHNLFLIQNCLKTLAVSAKYTLWVKLILKDILNFGKMTIRRQQILSWLSYFNEINWTVVSQQKNWLVLASKKTSNNNQTNLDLWAYLLANIFWHY